MIVGDDPEAVSLAVRLGLFVRARCRLAAAPAMAAAGARVVEVVDPPVGPWPFEASSLLGSRVVARVALAADDGERSARVAGAGRAGVDLLWCMGMPPPRLDDVQTAWREAVEAGVSVRIDDVVLPPPVVGGVGAPLPVVPSLVDLLRADLDLPALRAGLSVAGDGVPPTAERVGGVPTLGRLLGAVGWPVHELPRCIGGLGRGQGPRCDVCPGGSACGGGADAEAPSVARGLGPTPCVHIVIPLLADRLMVDLTLPALAGALRAAGAEVVVHSAWHAPTNPHGGDALTAALGVDDHARHAHATAHVRDFARALDLSGADAVVVPGWDWGGLVWRHPTLPADARVVLADDHLLAGVEAWKRRHLPAGARSLVTPWWPSERIHVHSAFPGYARLAWYAGVPLGQVWWRPYPMATEALPPGGDPAVATEILAAGNHLRDHDALSAAARADRALTVLSRHRPPPVDGLRWERPVPLAALHARLQRARAVVVSVRYEREKAAGISIIAMAQAAGRPVVATCTPGTLDHVRHEVDGLLVPAGDPSALSRALDRIAGDDALVRRLGVGARAAATRADVRHWAEALLHGAPQQPVGPATGPWRAW